MRLKEQRLWDRMRNNRAQDVRLERLENMATDGIPDVLAKHRRNRIPIFIELKAVDLLPARASTRVFGDEGLRVAQANWLLDWTKYGGAALIVCSVGSAHEAYHWVIDGTRHDEFNKMNIGDLNGAALVRGSGGQFWESLWQLVGDFR